MPRKAGQRDGVMPEQPGYAMHTPKKATPSVLAGNATVSLLPPRAPHGVAPVAANNGDEPADAASAQEDAAPAPARRRPRFSTSLWLALLLWAAVALTLTLLDLAFRLLAP